MSKLVNELPIFLLFTYVTLLYCCINSSSNNSITMNTTSSIMNGGGAYKMIEIKKVTMFYNMFILKKHKNNSQIVSLNENIIIERSLSNVQRLKNIQTPYLHQLDKIHTV